MIDSKDNYLGGNYVRINELLRTTLRYNKIYVYVRYNNAATPTEGDGSTCGVCMLAGDADGTNT